MNNIENLCPVCGLDLEEKPWDNNGPREDIICPCCGTQFGYHDAIRNTGNFNATVKRYNQLRKEWLNQGGKWQSTKIEPEHWNKDEQLEQII